MNSRERFLETMKFGTPDRVPYFEEGIREEVMEKWNMQGCLPSGQIEDLFPTDRREEIEPDLDPRPKLDNWPDSVEELSQLKERLNPHDPARLPKNWKKRVNAWKKREHPLMLRVHRGFFLTMGVYGWDRFLSVIYKLKEDPGYVHEVLKIQGEFCAALAERILSELEVDAAIFSEPIGGNDHPLMSPQMYEDFVLRSYAPLLDVLKNRGVEIIIFRTYANAKILIPKILKWGFNCLWACEVNIASMDYRKLREEFGKNLRLIGGIDLDALRRGKDAIKREIESKVPPLLRQGGYIPLADGRVREDVPFENYACYRKLLEQEMEKVFNVPLRGKAV